MKQKRKEALWGLAFILPSLAGITIFYIIPYGICFVKSLYIGEQFVGLANYAELFTNKAFILAMKNTGIFTVTALPLLMLVSFMIALFLNSFRRLHVFFRSSLLIPVVVPVASLISVWQVLFEDFGAVNFLLDKLGLEAVDFFSSDLSMVMIVLIYVWKYTGFCVVLFTSGLASVPQSLYESARLDGANKLQLVTRITVPMIIPTAFFVFLMEIIYSFKIFREVFALFGDYPHESVYFLQNFINNNYYNMNYPRLSAASTILSLLIILILLVFYRLESRHSHT
ncbi:MAG: sugar ABC transporter permease [Ruminococcus sp.]|nr:sugar ABC transporter permease [Ruminococcus sp.]